jgi:hypothetical protein
MVFSIRRLISNAISHAITILNSTIRFLPPEYCLNMCGELVARGIAYFPILVVPITTKGNIDAGTAYDLVIAIPTTYQVVTSISPQRVTAVVSR